MARKTHPLRQPRTPSPLSRRGFLNYLLSFSMALFMTGSSGTAILFALPRFRKGEFGGVLAMPVGEAPPPDAARKEFPEERF